MFILSFQIQNLRGRDQTRTFLFRIHASACKRQNESVTKMFWIRQESGKITSSVNLVSENREHLKYFRNVDWATNYHKWEGTQKCLKTRK